MRHVVITGLGVVAPCGADVPAFWEAVRHGRSAIGPIASFSTEDLEVTIAAEVKAFADAPVFARRAVPMDRFAQFGLAAAREAIADAGIVFDRDLAARTATIVGTAVGGQHAQEENYRRLYGQANGRVHPFVVPRIMANAAASVITMAHGLTGPTFAVSSA